MKIISPSVTLIHATPDPERVIERAGRTCWKSEGRITEDSHRAFIAMLKGKNHESVLEHASAGFLIITDRGILAEITRHRIASYSVESSRFCCYSKDKFGGEIAVVRPSGITEDGPLYEKWKTGCRLAESHYFDLLKGGAPPENARSVLPTCLKTEIAMTANFRSWRNFLTLRLGPSAHPDIRVIAEMIRCELVKLAPSVFDDFIP